MFEIRDITKIKINDRLIGDGEPCFIIAEVGCGHDGSYENAKNMVDMAVEAKCDAVKFQTFEANKLFNEFTQEHVVEKLKKWEFKREWHKPLKDYAESKGLIFLSSAFSEEDIDFLEQLFIPAHKVASYEMTDKHLVECIAKKQKPVLMSCGIATIEEIEKSV